MEKKCVVCGKPAVNTHWSTKQTFFCSFKCYAMSSAKLLLLLSFVFSVIFIGFGTWLLLSNSVQPPEKYVLLIPFITAEVLGPVPGFIISIIGFVYNKEEKENSKIEEID